MTLHIATSRELGGVVARAIHAPVCSVSENLLVGPSAADPEEHPRARADFWDLHGRDLTRARRSFRDLRAAIRSRQRVVLWTTRDLADTAALWWLCAWRLLRRPLQPDLDLVVLGPDAGPATEELRRWTTHTGDAFLATRLAQWAEHHGGEAAVESEPARPERGVMLASRYRLSKIGEAIRRQGLRGIAQGPSLAIFGVVAYDPLAPWVVVAEQTGRLGFLQGEV